jgi:type IV secretory pathway TrbD component
MSRQQQVEPAIMMPGARRGLVAGTAAVAVLVSYRHWCAEEMHSTEKARHEPTMECVVAVQVLQYY